MVNQNPLLFNTSIGENIAYGAPDREVSEAEIQAAARLANAHDFIMSFRGGYDTLAGTMGTQVIPSLGQASTPSLSSCQAARDRGWPSPGPPSGTRRSSY